MQLSLSPSWRGTQQRSIIKGVRSKESCYTCWTLWFSVCPDSVTFSPQSPQNIEGNHVPGNILWEMQPGRIKYKLPSMILAAPPDRTLYLSPLSSYPSCPLPQIICYSPWVDLYLCGPAPRGPLSLFPNGQSSTNVSRVCPNGTSSVTLSLSSFRVHGCLVL